MRSLQRPRLCPIVAAVVAAVVALSSACGSEPRAEQPVVATREPRAEQPVVATHEPDVVPHDRPNHASLCEPDRRFASGNVFPCSHDSDCVACGCAPVNRAEHRRLGGDAYCERFNVPPAREECVATNGAACCDSACVLVR